MRSPSEWDCRVTTCNMPLRDAVLHSQPECGLVPSLPGKNGRRVSTGVESRVNLIRLNSFHEAGV
jgi:hypothetical protein